MRPLNSPRLLAEDAAAQIRTAILTGQLKPGERLVEATVARQLNVSRGPVREALKLLGAEGLVEDEPRRGAFVLSLTTLDVREIYDLRAALEARAAKRVTEAAKPASLKALRKALTRHAEARAEGRHHDLRARRPQVPRDGLRAVRATSACSRCSCATSRCSTR